MTPYPPPQTSPSSELQQANDSSSPSGHLSEVLANRRALGLSNRIPCLTPYVAPLRPPGQTVVTLPSSAKPTRRTEWTPS